MVFPRGDSFIFTIDLSAYGPRTSVDPEPLVDLFLGTAPKEEETGIVQPMFDAGIDLGSWNDTVYDWDEAGIVQPMF